MKLCKLLAFFALLVLRFATCSAKSERCFWVIDAVQKDNLLEEACIIIPGGQYFLRIRVKCNDMMNSEMLRSLVSTGVNPVLNIESEAFGINHHKTRRFSMLISSTLIEMGDQYSCGCLSRNKTNENGRANKCFCNGVKPLCLQSEAIQMEDDGAKCCQIEKNCSSFSELCNPAWVVPLYIPEAVTALHCEVVDSGIGPYVNSHRFTVHLDGFHSPINNTIQNRLGEETAQLPSLSQQTPVNCLPNLTPVCVIGSQELANHIIYTSSEFEKMQLLKIQFDNSVGNRCASKQSLTSVDIKGALSLPDRILLNTGAGLFEMQGDYTDISASDKSKDYALVLSSCVSHVVGPAQSSVHTVTVLAFGEEQDQEKVFVALPEQGKPCNFIEQRDSNGQNVCQFLRSLLENTASYPCQVMSGSVSGVNSESFVVLVMLQTPFTNTYHLVQFEGRPPHIGHWTALFHFPTALNYSMESENDNWRKIESKFSGQDTQASSLVLSGFSFTAVVCNSLFIWGNALLYSPDGGNSIHWLTNFPGKSTVMVFTSSPFDGTFAFLTDDEQVWIGQSGSANLQRLKSSMGIKGLSPDLYNQNGASPLSVFFDSNGRLQQIIAEKNSGGETKCISREELLISTIITRQLFSQRREEIVKYYRKARTNPTSCIKEQSTQHKQHNSGERACPFARINFEARHDVLHTRKCLYKFEPSVQWDGGLIHKSTTLHEYFTEVCETVNSECTGTSQDTMQALRAYLPELIYLGRSEWYSFVFYLYLDYDFEVEPNAHSWSLIHLQASLHVSDTTVLNLTSRRTELIPQKAVKYEVTIQDGGLRLPQYRSGEGLTPASVHIQVWNSGLTCSTSCGYRGSFRGSYVMTVLLGCPAGRKLLFDPEASKNATGKKHFCSSVHGVPCFYFYRDFLPVFKLLDLATGQISQFHGKYGLKIVGGGPTYQSITDYTEDEQTKYNYQTTSSMASLIWASKLKTLGDIPVFNSKTNGISWLCGTQSPCADVGPNFPGNAEYFFKLEFSNRAVDSDSSNCDFTIRFVIRVHGLPPGSFNPSSVIVLSCIGILATFILTFFALKRQDSRLWTQLKNVFAKGIYGECRERIHNYRKNKVDPLADQIQLKTVGQGEASNEGSESGDDVSVETRGNTTAQRQDPDTKA